MVNEPPDFCPHCGGELVGVDEPTVQRCVDCEESVFYNPVPSARVAVLDSGGRSPPGSAAKPHDGDAMLLVTRPDGTWISPGGKVEVGTDPDEHAALELEAETSLVVDPDDLVLFDTATYVVTEIQHTVGIRFAVDYEDVSGEIEAGSDAGAARFWTAEELAATDEPTLDPDLFRTWVEGGRAALERATR